MINDGNHWYAEQRRMGRGAMDTVACFDDKQARKAFRSAWAGHAPREAWEPQ